MIFLFSLICCALKAHNSLMVTQHKIPWYDPTPSLYVKSLLLTLPRFEIIVQKSVVSVLPFMFDREKGLVSCEAPLCG